MIELDKSMIRELTAYQADQLVGKRFIICFEAFQNGKVEEIIQEATFIGYKGITTQINYFCFTEANQTFNVVYSQLISMLES